MCGVICGSSVAVALAAVVVVVVVAVMPVVVAIAAVEFDKKHETYVQYFLIMFTTVLLRFNVFCVFINFKYF